MKRKVVLYNPRAVFWTMPLGVLAVASALDEERFEPVIVDGRHERDPVGRVLAEAEDAVCVGLSVLTGGPIHDALALSRAVKGRYPALPVVWGGWHPSLFPVETLAEPSVDVTVQGQGEVTFRELVECLVDGRSPAGIAGLAWRDGHEVRQNPPRPLADMDALPRHRYELLDVERAFSAKGRRQIDVVTSTGCPFRCAFCADPFVFLRKWTAISPSRLGAELEQLQRATRFTEIAFQDETFFTYRDRVAAIAEELLRRGIRCRWTATLRADQAVRLPEEVLALCVRSGFSRAMIGVESGSQAMLDWMEKDITVEQVLAAAELCKRHGVGAIFPFIVGFPGESDGSVAASLELMKRLRRMSPEFDTPLFYFKPYPGSAITAKVVEAGHRLPETLEEWADFDFIGSSGPWVSADKERRVERFKFYNRFAGGREGWLRWPLQQLARWRCRHDRYGLPFEKLLVERLFPSPELS